VLFLLYAYGMQSLLYVKGSDGAANASQMTVTTIRASGAATILTNTVSNVPTFFYGSMGAPHTFTDPITGETITVISDATAVDFAGTVTSGHVDIVAIAPGYLDTRGSLVGDIVVVRPITEWANNIYNVLNQSLTDTGVLKTGAITLDAQFVTAISPVQRATDMIFDHVVTKLGTEVVLAGLGYGSTLTASLSAGICYINGNRQIIAAVATRTYTASKDTYVDALYNSSGTATIVYTEVTNNAASPALAANSIRLGIVVSGANIAAVTSINQGQENKLLPITSSTPYSVTDSLGNLICPRDPLRKVLGFRKTTTNFTTASASAVAVPGLSVPVIIPLGRKVEISTRSQNVGNSAAAYGDVSIYEGSTAGTLLGYGQFWASTGGRGSNMLVDAEYTPTTASLTYVTSLHAEGGGTANLNADTGGAYIRVKLA
jgi:hypothetical protein